MARLQQATTAPSEAREGEQKKNKKTRSAPRAVIYSNNYNRVYVSWSIDDDRLAVVVVEMTTRLVARPEDDDDDDEVHERARDSAVGYHCH
ncbi:hypothetical protein ALC62_06373 [Cyphomyrmex costatus]|uniref:Uncharacterized protein n=1 Tax=Cyphomyrmex costatus TaxID=456900 RepID=A0A195CQ83_9HYME|nr:hypothetical protein ALC62_06373 [Cyphomyrmex costatus]